MFLATAADWDSMDRIITQTHGQAFQTLGRAFDLLLSPQKADQVFQKLGLAFKGRVACFETKSRPSLLINGHTKNFL